VQARLSFSKHGAPDTLLGDDGENID